MLVEEVLRYLQPRPGETIVDATAGGGGHARAIARCLEDRGCIVLFDRDPEALAASESALRDASVDMASVHANFADIEEELVRRGLAPVHGVLFDLGVSSHQLDTPERGFSFQQEGPLDLRLDPGQGEPASALVARLSEEELADLFRRWGEERHARRIARVIVSARAARPIESTTELATLVTRASGGGRPGGIHPATRVFQALRIAVNDELRSLELGLEGAWRVLECGGRMVAISFQSLEDRVVKGYFAWRSGKCRCEPGLPSCRCGAKAEAEILTRKPVVAGVEEVARNPRARSAKLRAIRKL